MARTHTPGRETQDPQGLVPLGLAPLGLAPLGSASLVEAIGGLTLTVALLAERLSPPQPPPPFGGRGRLSVPELRALLREVPIDRSSLPAPIENLRRAELVEAQR